jgi:hypothetical protein
MAVFNGALALYAAGCPPFLHHIEEIVFCPLHITRHAAQWCFHSAVVVAVINIIRAVCHFILVTMI